jgi:hypothetical protein
MKTVWLLCSRSGYMPIKVVYATQARAVKGLQEMKRLYFDLDNIGLYECEVIEDENSLASND